MLSVPILAILALGPTAILVPVPGTWYQVLGPGTLVGLTKMFLGLGPRGVPVYCIGGPLQVVIALMGTGTGIIPVGPTYQYLVPGMNTGTSTSILCIGPTRRPTSAAAIA